MSDPEPYPKSLAILWDKIGGPYLIEEAEGYCHSCGKPLKGHKVKGTYDPSDKQWHITNVCEP